MFDTILLPIFLIWSICVLLLIRIPTIQNFKRGAHTAWKNTGLLFPEYLLSGPLINEERLRKILCDRLSYNCEQVLQATAQSKRGHQSILSTALSNRHPWQGQGRQPLVKQGNLFKSQCTWLDRILNFLACKDLWYRHIKIRISV